MFAKRRNGIAIKGCIATHEPRFPMLNRNHALSDAMFEEELQAPVTVDFQSRIKNFKSIITEDEEFGLMEIIIK
jgi:hypothetical protein